MPYVDQESRERLALGETPTTPGELSYLLSKTLDRYLMGVSESFAVYSEIVGVLETLKLEVVRRFLTPYENSKMSRNGDAFRFQHLSPKDKDDDANGG